MASETLVVMSLVLPLLTAVLVVNFRNFPNLRECCSILGSSLLLLVNVILATRVVAGERPELSLGIMIPRFEMGVSIEPLGMLFAIVASGLWVPTTFYAIGYMRGHNESHQARFFACFAIAIFAALAAAYAADLFTLFIAYELMTLCTYPLVTHHGTETARNAGRVYLGLLLTSSITLFMLAIAWTWFLAGTLDFRQGGILQDAFASGKVRRTELMVLLGMFAFGIGKAALMPFHRWLPAAMVAPTPVSALLHAVAVVKVGVFTILKVAVYVFGIDLLQQTGISQWLAYVAGVTIVVSSLIAMTKDNLKARLAYSTIGQLAYVTLGAALATPAGILGSGLHIVMHAVAKITLFFCAGAIYVATHKSNISQFDGLGRKMPWTFAAFLVASVSIIGLPPGGGAWSKWLLATSTAETHLYLLTAALMISSLLNIAYLIPIPLRAFWGDLTASVRTSDPTETTTEAPLFCVIPLCLTAGGSVALFFLADWIHSALLPIVASQ